jgi:hypothetical protein
VELRLRQSGIIVVPNTTENSLFPEVELRINLLIERDGLAAYNMEIALLRFLQVPATNIDLAAVTTWSNSKIVTIGKSKLVASLKEDADELAIKFANVYLEQNPKK